MDAPPDLDLTELFRNAEFDRLVSHLSTVPFGQLSEDQQVMFASALCELERYEDVLQLDVNLDSQSAKFLDLYAVAAILSNDYQRALEAIEIALLITRTPRLLHLLASAQAAARNDYEIPGDELAAIKDILDEAIAMPACPLAVFMWSERLVGYGDADLLVREKILREAIEKHPEADEPRVRLAPWLTGRLGRPDEAVEILMPRIRVGTLNPRVWLLAYFAGTVLANSELAAFCLDHVKFDDEDDSRVLSLLKADTFLLLEKPLDALTEYAAAKDARNDGVRVASLFGSVLCEIALGRSKDARSAAGMAIAFTLENYHQPFGHEPIWLGDDTYGYDYGTNCAQVCEFYLNADQNEWPLNPYDAAALKFLRFKSLVEDFENEQWSTPELLLSAAQDNDHPAISNYLAGHFGRCDKWTEAVSHHLRYILWASSHDRSYLPSEFLNIWLDAPPLLKKAERKKVIRIVEDALDQFAGNERAIKEGLRPLYLYFLRAQLREDHLSKTIIKCARLIFEVTGFDSDVVWDLAYHLNSVGHSSEAAEKYRLLIEKSPNNSSALHNLSIIVESDGELEEAVKLSEQAATLAGDDRLIVDRFNGLRKKLQSSQIQRKANDVDQSKKGRRVSAAGVVNTGRKSLSKRLRFEVFKRDSFTCQYCGRKSPDVVLVVDHIEPVASGGTNDLLNLITSCFDCNSGKSDKKLSDNSVIEKRRLQLEELQERKEQIEMMLEWQKELKSLNDHTVEQLAGYWTEQVSPFALNENGRTTLKKLLRQFSVTEVMEAIDTAVVQYVKFEGALPVQETVENAWSKVGGICRVTRVQKDKPYMAHLYYIRGILRNRLSYTNDWVIMQKLESIVQNGGEIDRLKAIALEAGNWTVWQELMEEYRGELQ